MPACGHMKHMTHENFAGMPRREHPEVKENPEAMWPATQETQRGLRDAIVHKTRYQAEKNGKRNADLYKRPDAVFPDASVQFMAKGTFKQYPDAIGYIRRREAVPTTHSCVTTSYYIEDLPDGLHISKFIQGMSAAEATTLFQGAPEDEVRVLAEIAKLQIRTVRAQAAERALGLDFVSEYEASQLLEFLGPLETRRR